MPGWYDIKGADLSDKEDLTHSPHRKKEVIMWPYSEFDNLRSNTLTCLPSCLRTSLLPCLFLLSHLFISGCANDKSSTIDPELLKQKTPEQVQQHKQQALEQETALAAADLEVTTYKVLSPNEQAPFTLSTSPQQYSDANLQISLTASTTSPDSSIVIRSQWTQLQGPQAIIVTPDSLSTLAVMPNVDKPTKLIFRIAAVDSTNYVTSTTSVVYVSPPPPTITPTTPPVTDTSFTQQANVTPGTSVTSNAISVGNISEATIISIFGGEYSLDGGTTYTQQQATVGPGDSVIIRLNASQNQGTTTLATLSIGGTIYSFSVSTEAAVIPPPTQGPIETPKEFRPFITTWKTVASDNTNQVTINAPGGAYNYSINWGDGLSNENVTGAISHTYQQPGTYTVAISGDFPRLSFRDSRNLLSIEQWGDIEWESMADAFYGCVNLVSNAIDAPNLSKVTDMSYMFSNATAFNQDLSSWDVSSVTDMRYMFRRATAFNQDLSSWDVSSVTNMGSMFSDADAFNQDLSRWDVSSVTDMRYMFSGAAVFNQDLSRWDVSSVNTMRGMFYRATAFNQDLSRWDVSSVTDMARMFYLATAFNQDLSRWDVSSVTDMYWILTGSAFSTENYDALLLSWSGQPLRYSVNFGTDASYSSSSQAARDVLTRTFRWIITDGGIKVETVVDAN